MSQTPVWKPVMQHLDPERLAALDDETPTAEELVHLAACVACQQERDAFAQLRVAAIAPPFAGAPPLTEWATLSAALGREGLMARSGAARQLPHDGSGAASTPVFASESRRVRRVRRMPTWLRAAAALALVAGGVAAGRLSAGESVLPVSADVATLAANDDNDAEFASATDASTVLDRAQRDYQRASLWLASHDTTVNAQAVYRARLAALDQMMMASRAGLYEAPQDPVLNQYYLAAYTAREATLRQLGASLSVDRVMERF